MLAYLDGVLEHKGSNYVIIDVNGLGFKVYVLPRSFADMPAVKQRIRLYVRLYVKEDNALLFGFCTMNEVDAFEMLMGVSGVGPKAALALLDAYVPDELFAAIAEQDVKALSKAQGIGSKTAQRIIVELKDKFKQFKQADDTFVPIHKGDEGVRSQAMEALMALGYTAAEAAKALEGLDDNIRSVEQLIKDALKRL